MQRLRADTIICDILSKHQMRKEKKNKKKIIKMEHKAKEDKKKPKRQILSEMANHDVFKMHITTKFSKIYEIRLARSCDAQRDSENYKRGFSLDLKNGNKLFLNVSQNLDLLYVTLKTYQNRYLIIGYISMVYARKIVT